MNPARLTLGAVLGGALTGFVAGCLVDEGREPVVLAVARQAPMAPLDVGRSARAPGTARVAEAAAAMPDADGPDLPALLHAPPGELRASVLTALRHRAHGGWLYARALVQPCATLELMALRAQVAEPVSLDLNNPRAQRAASQRDQLSAACAQLQPEEIQEAMNVPPGSTDPLIALRDRQVQPGSAEARDRMAAILARPDPLMLAALGPGLLQRDGEAYVFDGQRHGDETERREMEAAAVLLACSLGLPCDDSNELVWAPCLIDGDCRHATLADSVMDELGAADHPERRAAVLAWVGKLRDAVLAREVDRFVKPPAR
ncbi:hypothetical protein [Roseateles noduli]|uniref:hypothetical protein n=1 Tax=Roseateles noduli TaxID=2052484 RepID=UPI003D647555